MKNHINDFVSKLRIFHDKDLGEDYLMQITSIQSKRLKGDIFSHKYCNGIIVPITNSSGTWKPYYMDKHISAIHNIPYSMLKKVPKKCEELRDYFGTLRMDSFNNSEI